VESIPGLLKSFKIRAQLSVVKLDSTINHFEINCKKLWNNRAGTNRLDCVDLCLQIELHFHLAVTAWLIRLHLIITNKWKNNSFKIVLKRNIRYTETTVITDSVKTSPLIDEK
jgi:hypothetical protein